jgi:hypothetical protein
MNIWHWSQILHEVPDLYSTGTNQKQTKNFWSSVSFWVWFFKTNLRLKTFCICSHFKTWYCAFCASVRNTVTGTNNTKNGLTRIGAA